MLSLLGLLAGVFGFLALLEGGLNHVVLHARRSERSADFGREPTIFASEVWVVRTNLVGECQLIGNHSFVGNYQDSKSAGWNIS